MEIKEQFCTLFTPMEIKEQIWTILTPMEIIEQILTILTPMEIKKEQQLWLRALTLCLFMNHAHFNDGFSEVRSETETYIRVHEQVHQSWVIDIVVLCLPVYNQSLTQ